MVELTSENLEQIANAVTEKITENSDPTSLLGTVSDIWVLIALIIPGFITLTIIRWFIKDIGSTPDKFLITIYSLIGSIGLIIVLSQLDIDGIQINSIDQIKDYATNFSIIGILYGLAIAFGIGIGVVLKYIVYKNTFAGSAWDEFVKRNIGKFVKVYTTYDEVPVIMSGYIKSASTGNDEKKELTLGSPAIWKDDKWKFLDKPENGEQIIEEVYLPENSIKKIEKIR